MSKIRINELARELEVKPGVILELLHELGHVLGAVISGGQVERVVLHPLTISRTDLRENPHPLWVVWCGPILGCLFPLVLWQIARWRNESLSFLLRFVAGFCLLANGLYISIGSFDHVGDCVEMFRHGSPPWMLWLFGAVTVPTGLWLWHRQGPHFGWGEAAINSHAIKLSVLTAVGLILLGWIFGGR